VSNLAPALGAAANRKWRRKLLKSLKMESKMAAGASAAAEG
jgi:hypothetical protein